MKIEQELKECSFKPERVTKSKDRLFFAQGGNGEGGKQFELQNTLF
jgi:hypothetical protein